MPERPAAREKQIKGWGRQKKIDLIEADNPNWGDLSKRWIETVSESDLYPSKARGAPLYRPQASRCRAEKQQIPRNSARDDIRDMERCFAGAIATNSLRFVHASISMFTRSGGLPITPADEVLR